MIRVESGGYRFADPVTAARLAAQLAPALRPTVMNEIATRLIDLDATAARVADLLLAAGEPAMAAPFALAAARIAAASGLYAEVLRWTEAVRDHVDGEAEPALLSLRADALAAVGDHAAVPAYRKAVATASPDQAAGLRTRLARAAVLSGDLASAEEALAGLEPNGGPDDGAILLVRGMLAYFSGDIDSADAAVEAARAMALAPGAPNRLLDVITLQGMIAHNRGERFDRLRRELRATTEHPELASAVFDSHLCVAEYLLYGPTPYDEVVALTDQLREQAERTGARRGVAFAVTVAGEAALLAGDLDAARADLAEALALHVEMGADTGAAHALQRLAEPFSCIFCQVMIAVPGLDRVYRGRAAGRGSLLARPGRAVGGDLAGHGMAGSGGRGTSPPRSGRRRPCRRRPPPGQGGDAVRPRRTAARRSALPGRRRPRRRSTCTVASAKTPANPASTSHRYATVPEKVSP